MENLSHLLPSSPHIGNSSMSATNTVSDETGSMTAPGSRSEITDDIAPHTPTPLPTATTGPTTVVDGNDSSPRGGSCYDQADGHGWKRCTENGIDDGTQQPRGSDGQWREA